MNPIEPLGWVALLDDECREIKHMGRMPFFTPTDVVRFHCTQSCKVRSWILFEDPETDIPMNTDLDDALGCSADMEPHDEFVVTLKLHY